MHIERVVMYRSSAFACLLNGLSWNGYGLYALHDGCSQHHETRPLCLHHFSSVRHVLAKIITLINLLSSRLDVAAEIQLVEGSLFATFILQVGRKDTHCKQFNLQCDADKGR